MAATANPTSVVIPVELRERARDLGVNISEACRDGLELAIEQAEAWAAGEVAEYRVPIATQEGYIVDGVITGRLICEDDANQWYATDDERLIFYDASRQSAEDVPSNHPDFDIVWSELDPDVQTQLAPYVGRRPEIRL